MSLSKGISFLRSACWGGDAEDYLAKNAKDFEMLKLRGTPTFIIGSTIYPGYKDFEAFKAIISKEIVKQTTN